MSNLTLQLDGDALREASDITSYQQWMLISKVEFNDEGEPEFNLIHKGTENECKALMDMLPAIAYSGTRPTIGGTLHIIPDCER